METNLRKVSARETMQAVLTAAAHAQQVDMKDVSELTPVTCTQVLNRIAMDTPYAVASVDGMKDFQTTAGALGRAVKLLEVQIVP